jgi:hypothetical protein
MKGIRVLKKKEIINFIKHLNPSCLDLNSIEYDNSQKLIISLDEKEKVEIEDDFKDGDRSISIRFSIKVEEIHKHNKDSNLMVMNAYL